uniref:Uncharacterized protein n=1 Tax=Noctiluca scintillans TaxID=2966 RepID=A0A6T8XNU7_NOCSC|mmetsp:Transcript_31842/g.85065  ORF Transcript_31842/g.85065 Transcript_31842/m.85065 type:complete len:279 (+) Transcript_31842:52-888(+)
MPLYRREDPPCVDASLFKDSIPIPRSRTNHGVWTPRLSALVPHGSAPGSRDEPRDVVDVYDDARQLCRHCGQYPGHEVPPSFISPRGTSVSAHGDNHERGVEGVATMARELRRTLQHIGMLAHRAGECFDSLGVATQDTTVTLGGRTLEEEGLGRGTAESVSRSKEEGREEPLRPDQTWVHCEVERHGRSPSTGSGTSACVPWHFENASTVAVPSESHLAFRRGMVLPLLDTSVTRDSTRESKPAGLAEATTSFERELAMTDSPGSRMEAYARRRRNA